MNQTIVKSAVAVVFSTGLLIGGISPAFAAANDTAAPVADTGSSSASSAAGLLLAPLLCRLSGGTYTGSGETTTATCTH
ncbi:hypothetical protein [Nocardia sp.]|uniref:hypothetical protein n=1 Tax=Nocardia sp. TaxID=1821 RepID=UPI002637C7DA|nr:hypothetical protein [Nocardia sp.]